MKIKLQQKNFARLEKEANMKIEQSRNEFDQDMKIDLVYVNLLKYEKFRDLKVQHCIGALTQILLIQ